MCRVLRASYASAGRLPVEVLMEIGQHLVGRGVVVLLALLLALLVLQEMLPPRRVPARVAEIALQRGASRAARRGRRNCVGNTPRQRKTSSSSFRSRHCRWRSSIQSADQQGARHQPHGRGPNIGSMTSAHSAHFGGEACPCDLVCVSTPWAGLADGP